MAISDTAISNSSVAISHLIDRYNRGDAKARDVLVQRLYRDLRRLAAAQLRSERPNHTLQPTALVHEAYARLIKQSDGVQLQNRSHFLAIVSQLMRQILVDHGRAHVAAKRGGVRHQVTLDDGPFAEEQSRSVDVLALDEALTRLSQLDPRQGKIVEMHFFAGLTFEEIGRVFDLNERTIKRDWAMARAWLRNQLRAELGKHE